MATDLENDAIALLNKHKRLTRPAWTIDDLIEWGANRGLTRTVDIARTICVSPRTLQSWLSTGSELHRRPMPLWVEPVCWALDNGWLPPLGWKKRGR